MKQLLDLFLYIQSHKKSPAISRGSFYVNYIELHRYDVAGLGSLGALLNCELNLLAFLQVAVAIALNGGEMDEYVLAAFALDEAEALVTVEPFDRTSYSVRHVLPPMAI